MRTFKLGIYAYDAQLHMTGFLIKISKNLKFNRVQIQDKIGIEKDKRKSTMYESTVFLIFRKIPLSLVSTTWADCPSLGLLTFF